MAMMTDGHRPPYGGGLGSQQVLVKMLNAGLFAELNGCVSTGKEANVYQAATAEGTDLAVKVYKTSILTFKDRDRRDRNTALLSRFLHRYPKEWRMHV